MTIRTMKKFFIKTTGVKEVLTGTRKEATSSKLYKDKLNCRKDSKVTKLNKNLNNKNNK